MQYRIDQSRPVTVEEHESREAERYDKQLKELGYDIEGKSSKEKVKILARI